jgi:hypothetical protein
MYNKVYNIKKEVFYKYKQILDGFVFWQENGDFMLLKQVAPQSQIKKLI